MQKLFIGTKNIKNGYVVVKNLHMKTLLIGCHYQTYQKHQKGKPNDLVCYLSSMLLLPWVFYRIFERVKEVVEDMALKKDEYWAGFIDGKIDGNYTGASPSLTAISKIKWVIGLQYDDIRKVKITEIKQR